MSEKNTIGAALAALRKLEEHTCEFCGVKFHAIRKEGYARTCGRKCRVKLCRKRKKEQTTGGV